jgi:hypothetical protein
MRVGELLDAAIKLYRRNWKPLMGIAAFVMVPFSFLQSYLTRSSATNPFTLNPGRLGEQQPVPPGTVDTALVGLVFTLVLFLFIQPFLTAAFAKAASDVYLGGRPTVKEIYAFALSRLFAILLVTVLTALAVLGGFVLLIVPGVILLVRFAFGPVVVVLEDARGTTAMRRSWRLSRGFFWKILGTLLLASLIATVVSGIVSFPLIAGGLALGSKGWALRAVGGAIGSVITRPFASLVGVLLYFDLRIRKEGLDLEIMARELEAPPS